MIKIEYGAMSSKYEVTANDKLTAYAAIVLQYGCSAGMVAIYTDEYKSDCWLNFDGSTLEKLDNLYGGNGYFLKYLQLNAEEIKKANKTIKQLI